MVAKKTRRKRRAQQRRNAERIYAKLYIAYRRSRAKRSKERLWSCIPYNDISGLGISVILNERLRTGEKVELSIKIPGDTARPCKVLSKVVWCTKMRPHGFKAGLQFIDADKHARLIEFVCEHMADMAIYKREDL